MERRPPRHPHLEALLVLVVVVIVTGILVYVFFSFVTATYVNQTDDPLRFTAYRVDDPRYFLSQVVVPAHGERQVRLPKYAPGIRIVATRPNGLVAFEHLYTMSELEATRDRVVVTSVPLVP